MNIFVCFFYVGDSLVCGIYGKHETDKKPVASVHCLTGFSCRIIIFSILFHDLIVFNSHVILLLDLFGFKRFIMYQIVCAICCFVNLRFIIHGYALHLNNLCFLRNVIHCWNVLMKQYYQSHSFCCVLMLHVLMYYLF